jgi:hypothetical protein
LELQPKEINRYPLASFVLLAPNMSVPFFFYILSIRRLNILTEDQLRSMD